MSTRDFAIINAGIPKNAFLTQKSRGNICYKIIVRLQTVVGSSFIVGSFTFVTASLKFIMKIHY
jgi:hypothetical protein